MSFCAITRRLTRTCEGECLVVGGDAVGTNRRHRRRVVARKGVGAGVAAGGRYAAIVGRLDDDVGVEDASGGARDALYLFSGCNVRVQCRSCAVSSYITSG